MLEIYYLALVFFFITVYIRTYRQIRANRLSHIRKILNTIPKSIEKYHDL